MSAEEQQSLVFGRTSCPKLKVQELAHRYGAVAVLNSVSIDLEGGLVYGVYGPNGAGKSTLLKIIAGQIKPSRGKIYLENDEIRTGSPYDSRKLGIRYISQELSLIDSWTVEEQIEYEFDGANAEAAYALLEELGFSAATDAKVGDLTQEQKQLLEISKSLHPGTRVVLFDEPTSGLDANQRDVFYDKLKDLASDGAIVVLVSHDLKRLETASDKFLRVENASIEFTNRIPAPEAKTIAAAKNEERAFSAECINVSLSDLQRIELPFKRISGLTGTLRSNVDRILRGIYGLDDSIKEFKLGGLSFSPSIKTSRELSIRYVSQYRNSEWGFGSKPIWENIDLRLNARSSHFFYNERQRQSRAVETLKMADVRPLEPEKPFSQFSGGNRQKAIVASEIERNPSVLLLDEPLSGIDVEAREWLGRALRQYVENGGTAIIYSQERADLRQLCDFVTEIEIPLNEPLVQEKD